MKKLIGLVCAGCILVSSVIGVTAAAPDAGSEADVIADPVNTEAYDIDGDGAITYRDVVIADNDREKAQEEGREYTGVRASDIVVFLVKDLMGEPGDYSKGGDLTGDGVVSGKDYATLVRYIECCEKDGVEYPGMSEEEWLSVYTQPMADPTPHDPMDANRDGIVNAKDVAFIMRVIVSNGVRGDVYRDADVNGDGVVNARDITAFFRYNLG